MVDDDLGIEFIFVDNKSLLNPSHTKMPVYVPALKCTLSIHHFVRVSTDIGKSFLGEIIGRSNDRAYPKRLSIFVAISLCFPWK
jgi:hypothetical protein